MSYNKANNLVQPEILPTLLSILSGLQRMHNLKFNLLTSSKLTYYTSKQSSGLKDCPFVCKNTASIPVKYAKLDGGN